jgi:hypothetical protein
MYHEEEYKQVRDGGIIMTVVLRMECYGRKVITKRHGAKLGKPR